MTAGQVEAGRGQPARTGSVRAERFKRSALTGWPVLLAALAVSLLLTGFDARGWDFTPSVLALAVLAWAPLLADFRAPLLVLGGAVAGDALHVGLLEPQGAAAVPVATMVAAFALGVRRRPRTAWAGGAAAGALLLATGLLTRSEHLGTDMVVLDLVLAAAGAGVLVRDRHEHIQAAEQRAKVAELAKDDEARRQVAAERLRIARELHDVLAHNLALVNAQAGVADYLLRTDPDAAATALRGITRHTRQALDELRATVGLLRHDSDSDDNPDEAVHGDRQPVPGLGGVEQLISGFQAAGTTISLTVTGAARPLAGLSDLAAYRILQEALTNASKHAPGAAVRVSLRWEERDLHLSVANDRPPGQPGQHGPGTGHGLLGMRERALLCGGDVQTGATPDGGFLVAATIPAGPPPGPDPRAQAPTAPAAAS